MKARIDQQQQNKGETAMNLNMTIGDLLTAALTQTATQTEQPEPGSSLIGTQVIVRTSGAGVLYGRLEEVVGTTVRLADARQIWAWDSTDRLALTDLASLGTPLGSGSKFSGPCDTAVITGVHAILACTAGAVAAIGAVPAWK
jgi:hypothetical protein